MRQSEARDLRSFLAEPVEEFVVKAAKDTDPFLQNPNMDTQLQEVGVQFITPWRGTEEQLPGTGVQFAIPWEGTGGQLHEVGARFTSPLTLENDLALQQTMPMPRVPEQSGAQSGLSSLRPYRLQRYQSRPAEFSRPTSGMLRLRPAGERRAATADLAPAPHKIVPGEPSPALQSWERKRRTIYTWLILLTLFLLVILGGIGLDSLIASYR